MPLNIKNEQAHILAKELAHLMDESITTAVTKAISEALDRRRYLRKEKIIKIIDQLTEAADFTAELPLRDKRTPEDIIGYDEKGLPV
jgi:antitoxin VapB